MHKKILNSRLFKLFVFLGLCFYLSEITGVRQNINAESIKNVFTDNIVLSTLSFIILFSLANLLQIPGWPFLAAAIASLGKVHGGSLTFVAAFISCNISYFLVHFVGEDALRQLDNKLAHKIRSYLDRYPIGSIVLLRAIFQTFPPINYSLSLSGISYRSYFIGTLLGLPIPILFFTLLSDKIFGHFLKF